MNDRAERIHRAELHTRNSSPHSCRTPASAHRPGIDRWLSRQLLAERAWTRRSVLGGLDGRYRLTSPPERGWTTRRLPPLTLPAAAPPFNGPVAPGVGYTLVQCV